MRFIEEEVAILTVTGAKTQGKPHADDIITVREIFSTLEEIKFLTVELLGMLTGKVKPGKKKTKSELPEESAKAPVSRGGATGDEKNKLLEPAPAFNFCYKMFRVYETYWSKYEEATNHLQAMTESKPWFRVSEVKRVCSAPRKGWGGSFPAFQMTPLTHPTCQ